MIRNRAARLREVKKTLKLMVPHASLSDFEKIMKIADSQHLNHLPTPILAWRSLTTHIRHNHSDYDALLEEGYDIESAKHFVLDEMNAVLESWGASKRIELNSETANELSDETDV
ncbi:MAG: DUF2293 domain-containing protein [Nitratireductor sp.]